MTLRRTGGTSGVVSAQLIPTGQTAKRGRDFVLVIPTISWADGDGADKTVRFQTLDNQTVDGDRTLVIYLVNAQGGAKRGTPFMIPAVIRDND